MTKNKTSQAVIYTTLGLIAVLLITLIVVVISVPDTEPVEKKTEQEVRTSQVQESEESDVAPDGVEDVLSDIASTPETNVPVASVTNQSVSPETSVRNGDPIIRQMLTSNSSDAFNKTTDYFVYIPADEQEVQIPVAQNEPFVGVETDDSWFRLQAQDDITSLVFSKDDYVAYQTKPIVEAGEKVYGSIQTNLIRDNAVIYGNVYLSQGGSIQNNVIVYGNVFGNDMTFGNGNNIYGAVVSLIGSVAINDFNSFNQVIVVNGPTSFGSNNFVSEVRVNFQADTISFNDENDILRIVHEMWSDDGEVGIALANDNSVGYISSARRVTQGSGNLIARVDTPSR